MRASWLWCLLLVFAPLATAQQRVRYEVQLGDTDGNGISSPVRISIVLPDLTEGPRELVMPRSVPMGYALHFYDRYVAHVQGFDAAGKNLPVERLDGPRWRIGAVGSKVQRIHYEVDVTRMEREIPDGGDVSRARAGYVFLLGYSVFGFMDGLETLPIELRVNAPSNLKGWPVMSTLAPAVPPPVGGTTATAESFYALADSQIVSGPRFLLRRMDSRVPFFLVLYAEMETDADLTAKLMAEGFDAVVAYFGSAPFAHYTAVLELLKPLDAEHTYGFSVEHLESVNSCMEAEFALGASPSEQLRNRYRFLISHHATHAWIPKRTYGESYFPHPWEVAPVIDTIWFSEGVGNYVGIDALADRMPPEEATAFFSRMLERRFRGTLREVPAFLKKMPLTELSRIGSTQYASDFRVGRTLFSRGALMLEEMDKRIRTESHGRKRLRDALRGLVEWSEREKRCFRTEELPAIFKQTTGVDTRDILEKWIAPMNE